MNINLGQSSPREFNALPDTVRESNVNKFQELFPEETDPSLIENKLSLITSLPNQPEHDLDRLKNFN